MKYFNVQYNDGENKWLEMDLELNKLKKHLEWFEKEKPSFRLENYK